MLNIFFIWLGKSLSWILRRMGRHGSALPGLVTERLYPKFLPSMLAGLPEGVIIISGTNGKTTTTKMIAELLRGSGKRVFTNRTGGNFVRGVISSIIHSSSVNGRLNYDLAVFELDEAYAARFVKIFRPRAVVVLNITRDQLDRFGEIDNTARLLQKVVSEAMELVVLNDDDSRTANMAAHRPVYFGISQKLTGQFPNDEQLYGKIVKHKVSHRRLVELESIKDRHVSYMVNGKRFPADLLMDGQHNALNAAAALAAVLSLYPSSDVNGLLIILSRVKAAFGRGEVIEFGRRRIILQLVKNPASFRQALHVIDIHRPNLAGIIINDNYADGRDVSWLWDVDFVKLSKLPVITGGTRAYDMANRLKYDEIKARPELKLPRFIEEILSGVAEGQTGIIFTTYTAMLAARRQLAKHIKLEKI